MKVGWTYLRWMFTTNLRGPCFTRPPLLTLVIVVEAHKSPKGLLGQLGQLLRIKSKVKKWPMAQYPITASSHHDATNGKPPRSPSGPEEQLYFAWSVSKWAGLLGYGGYISSIYFSSKPTNNEVQFKAFGENVHVWMHFYRQEIVQV